MAYTQVPIEVDPHMEIPHEIEITQDSTKDYALQLLTNIYGQKQEERVWNHFLSRNWNQLDLHNLKMMSVSSTEMT